jgi:hypothetical protein
MTDLNVRIHIKDMDKADVWDEELEVELHDELQEAVQNVMGEVARIEIEVS